VLPEGDLEAPVVQGLDGQEREEDGQEDRVLRRLLLLQDEDDAVGGGDGEQQVQIAELLDQVEAASPAGRR
jgi:hypothetical protein